MKSVSVVVSPLGWACDNVIQFGSVVRVWAWMSASSMRGGATAWNGGWRHQGVHGERGTGRQGTASREDGSSVGMDVFPATPFQSCQMSPCMPQFLRGSRSILESRGQWSQHRDGLPRAYHRREGEYAGRVSRARASGNAGLFLSVWFRAWSRSVSRSYRAFTRVQP